MATASVEIQKVFLSTADNIMGPSSSDAILKLSKPVRATHFRLINANIPNSGYSFKDSNKKFYYSFSNDATVPGTSQFHEFSTTKRYTIGEICTELSTIAHITVTHLNNSFKLTIAHDNTSSSNFLHLPASSKLGISVNRVIAKGTQISCSNYVYLASTSCVYFASPTLYNRSVCSVNLFENNGSQYSDCVVSKIPFTSANSLGDIASYNQQSTNMMKLSSGELEINEIHVRLLGDDFKIYETNGLSSNFEIDFIDNRQNEVLNPGR